MITFDREVRVIWKRKFTGATVLFCLNRYLMILTNLVIIPTWGPVPNLPCIVLGWMDIVLNLLPYFVWNAFSTLRAYALCGRDWRIASLVCLLMIGPIAANLYNIPLQAPVNTPPPYDCVINNAVTLATHTKLVLVSRLSLISADAIVLGVTWWKTYRLKKAAEAAQIKTSIVDLLLRDGSLYFGIMLVLNVLHIVINFVEQVSFLGDMADTISSILISRFIMNLRDVDSQDRGLHTTIGTSPGSFHAGGGSEERRGGTLIFASTFVESMGAPLDHSSYHEGLYDDNSELSEPVEEGAEREKEGEEGDADVNEFV